MIDDSEVLFNPSAEPRHFSFPTSEKAIAWVENNFENGDDYITNKCLWQDTVQVDSSFNLQPFAITEDRRIFVYAFCSGRFRVIVAARKD